MIVAAILADAGLSLTDDVQPVELAGSEVAPTFAADAVDAAIVLGYQWYNLGEPPGSPTARATTPGSTP